MKTTFIYALIDPRNNEIRYIGKSNKPKYRYKAHLRCDGDCFRDRWIKKLKSENLYPDLLILEECDYNVWEEREIFWIKHYREIGKNLTNSTEGGRCPRHIPEEVILKRSLALKGKKAWNKGKKLSDDHKLKLSIANKNNQKLIKSKTGTKHSDETKRKMSKSRMGKKRGPYGPNPKISLNQKGKKRGPYKKKKL